LSDKVLVNTKVLPKEQQ